MYRTILVGIDSHEQSRDALAFARLIASRTGARLIAAHVYAGGWPYTYPADPNWDAELRRLSMDVVANALAGGPGDEEAAAVGSSSPAHGLHELAEREHADLIVVGSAHRGKLGRLMAGSTGRSLLNGAACAVAVAPSGFAGRTDAKLETIGVAYDGRAESEVALTGAVDLAQSVGARLALITLVYPPDRMFAPAPLANYDVDKLLESLTEKMEAAQERAVARIPVGLDCERRVYGDPTIALVDVENIDLMLMGSRNYGPLKRVLVGSLAQSLITEGPWPIIVFPRGNEGEAGEEKGVVALEEAR